MRSLILGRMTAPCLHIGATAPHLNPGASPRGASNPRGGFHRASLRHPFSGCAERRCSQVVCANIGRAHAQASGGRQRPFLGGLYGKGSLRQQSGIHHHSSLANRSVRRVRRVAAPPAGVRKAPGGGVWPAGAGRCRASARGLPGRCPGGLGGRERSLGLCHLPG